MKTIWNKVPAWLKAIIFVGVIMYPLIGIIQKTVVFNLQSNSGWGWALLVTIPILIIFWKLAQRLSKFKKTEDVKIEFNVNVTDKKVWFRIIGLMLITVTAISLFSAAFGEVPEKQQAFFAAFKQFDEITAIPLLLSIALTAGVVEETFYRGYIQNVLVRAYPKAAAFLGIAVLFALMHFLPLPLILAYIIVSTCYSIVADEFKSLGAVIIAHISVDVVLLLVGYYGELADPETLPVLPLIVGFIIALFLLFYGNKSLQLTNKKKLSIQA